MRTDTPDPAFSFLQLLADQNDLVVFCYDPEPGQFTYLNPAFESVFARRRENRQTGDGLADLVHPEDADYVRESYGQLLGGTLNKQVEFRILLPDKNTRWLRVKPHVLEVTPGKKMIAGSAEDITDWKHYSDTETKYSNKKNAILQILSHDLAGPLGQIQALSYLIATRIRPYQDEHLNTVTGIITETSKRSIKLIRDFVEQEFLESAEESLIKTRINIVEKIREMVEQFQHSQGNMSKTFGLTSSDPSIYVALDEVKFMQVISNLLSNAIKFTHDDGEITVHVEDQEPATAGGEPGTLLITVADNGIGIPEKYHATLFDKFTKARRPGLREEPSIGLGMSIIKTIVGWHGGKIWFRSKENEGTTFFIQVPRE